MDVEIEPVAHIGRIPVYDLTHQRNVLAKQQTRFSICPEMESEALQKQICMTCFYRTQRRIVTGSERVRCHPAKAIVTQNVYNCRDKCVIEVGRNHVHRTAKVDGVKVPVETVAQISSCGWKLRGLGNGFTCADCVHFVAIHHGQSIPGRYDSSSMREHTLIGGFCNLPPEGIDIEVKNRSGEPVTTRVHCAFQRKPITILDEPSCANCQHCVQPASEEWPGANGGGLMQIGTAVLRTGSDRLEQSVARLDFEQKTKDGLDPVPVWKELGAINQRYSNSEAGAYSAIAATVVGVDLTGPLIRVALNTGGTTLTFTLVGHDATIYHEGSKEIQIPPGQVVVDNASGNRAVIHLKLDPWRKRFGLRPLMSQYRKLPARPFVDGFMVRNPHPNRSQTRCPDCLPHRACDAHARGLRYDPFDDVFVFDFPGARDPRQIPTPPTGMLRIVEQDGVLIVLNGDDQAPHPAVFQRQLRYLLWKAEALHGFEGQQQVRQAWYKCLSSVPSKRLYINRLPEAIYPGTPVTIHRSRTIKESDEHPFIPTKARPRAITTVVPKDSVVSGQATLEPGVYVCLANLHGLVAYDEQGVPCYGINLQEACSWQTMGEGRWDAMTRGRSSSDSDRTAFHFVDADDWYRYNDYGARVQEAQDATDGAGRFWNWRNGHVHHTPKIETCWQQPVRFDLMNEEVTYPYDETIDRNQYLECLDEIEEVTKHIGARSGRWRYHGYSMINFSRPDRNFGEVSSVWSQHPMQDMWVDDEIDLRDQGDQEEEVGLDYPNHWHESEVEPYRFVDVYCPTCRCITAAIPMIDTTEAPPDCPACNSATVLLGYTEDDPEQLRRFAGLCLSCGARTTYFTPRDDRCPVCDVPMIATDEHRNYEYEEKAQGARVYRSSDDMLRRQQLERMGHNCPFWVRKGSGGDRNLVTQKSIERFHELNRQRRLKVEAR